MRASPTSSPLFRDRFTRIKIMSVYKMLFKVRAARDAAAVSTAKANRLSLSYGLGVAIGTALTIQVSIQSA